MRWMAFGVLLGLFVSSCSSDAPEAEAGTASAAADDGLRWPEGAAPRVAHVGPRFVALEWPACEGAVKEYRVVTTGGTSVVATGGRAILAGLRPATSYAVEVTAVGAGGSTAASASIAVTTPAETRLWPGATGPVVTGPVVPGP